ncbi:tRNA 2-selenouridine synthase [compost metagenome]
MPEVLPTIQVDEIWSRLLRAQVHIIDVRAPVEFGAGSIPASVNRPILNDAERALIGTTYKQEGSERAISLGHELVQGDIKTARVDAWSQEIQSHPETSIIACFRGGLRSQITQRWLAEKGHSVPRLAGGYKKMRQFLMEQISNFCTDQKMIVLTGKTGSGKTQLLNQLADRPVLNLEFLAKHRGSAFGAYSTGQPTQIDFENTLALTLGRLKKDFPNFPVIVEDESRLIGCCVQPEDFFKLLRRSPVLFLEESLETRIENTFQEYVASRVQDAHLFPDLQSALSKIRNKLGGLRHSEIATDMRRAEKVFYEQGDLSLSKIWIEKLICWYYDPMYDSSLAKRDPQILAKGNRHHIMSFLNSMD